MTRARDVANLIGSGNYSSTTFTATAGQTAFSISHTQGFVQVFMNGLLLDLTVDYTSNGSAITLTSGAAAGDEIEVVKYNTFSVGDAITQTAADTRYVNTTGDTMTGALTVDAAAATVLTVDRATSDGDIIDIQRGGTSAGKIGGTSNVLSVVGKDGNGGIAIQNNSYGDIIYPASNTSGGASDNAIDLGYNNGRWKNLYLSSGIYIGGTGSANHLDDYETGSFQLTVAGESTGSARGSGIYVKIGNLVHFQWYSGGMNISSSATPTLSGLPFTATDPLSGNNAAYSGFVAYHNTYCSNANTGYINLSNSILYFTALNSTGGSSINTGNPRYCMVAGTYYTAQ